MNVRFAETCRAHPLEFEGSEWDIFGTSIRDGRTPKELALTCTKDIFIGVFFDGTNNNKFRDTLGFAHSNVARLYEVYPGANATQTAPTFLPKVKPNGEKEPRPGFADAPFKASSVPADDYPYYRKIYVPGLGTPLPDVRDTGIGQVQKSGGLAMALLGQARLDWALLQLVNQVHAAVFGTPLQTTVDLGQLYRRSTETQINGWSLSLGIHGLAANMIQQQLEKVWNSYAESTGTYAADAFNKLLDSYVQKLAAALKARGNNKPHLRKIRLSVFGFSRGATEARAWVNLLSQRWGDALAGIPLQIDFLGIFDTVASVGLAQSTPPIGHKFEGHAAWADSQNLVVPGHVKRCVHLVAAFEVRGSFPLDSVCQGNSLPSNCKEIVYPGVHSDVGGGYPPGDQGRALGAGAQGDQLKISQIPLAQMYREARMAGVPLAPPSAMSAPQRDNFKIAPKLREDFNAYIAATRKGSVPPTQGKGQASFGSMFPTETQPRGELHRVMRHHSGFLLRWRKAQMNRAGGASALPGLSRNPSDSKHQDIEDIRGAEQELRKEIIFLESKDPKKFEQIDDPLFDTVLGWTGLASNVGGIPGGQLVALASNVVNWSLKSALRSMMQEKQQQWDTWLHAEWANHDGNALPAAATQLFENYVHDSRAWFKPFIRTDLGGLVPDDESWFVLGEREKDRQSQITAAKKRADHARKSGDRQALAEAEQMLKVLQQDGQPLLLGGREPYRLWGYVRHRRLFQAGQLTDPGYSSRQAAIEREENDRILQQARSDRTAKENARHEERMSQLMERNREVYSNARLSSTQKKEFDDGTRAQIAREKQEHAENLARIEGATITSH